MKRIVYYDPDVIGAHDYPYLKAAVYAKRALQVPLVYDAHELYPEINTLTRKQKFIIRRTENQLVKSCDRVITVNPFLAQVMADRYQIPMPAVILNAVSRPAAFDSTQPHNLLRKCFAIPGDHKIILFQGWFSPERGLKDLVRAFALLDNRFHLVLMGYGDYQHELLKTAQMDNIAHRVHLKEAVSQAELLFWSASADAGIIPYPPIDLNHHYCSPNKLYEFIQAGLPVIANDLPYLRQVIAGEAFGAVAPLTSAQNIADAITCFFDPTQTDLSVFKHNLITKARSYQWESQEPLLLSIYDVFR